MYAAPIMILVDTSFALDHERLRNAVTDMHHKGFDTICFEFRNCIFDEYDAAGQAAMKVVADRTKELGVRFVKIMPMIGLNLVKKYPEDRQVWAVEHRARVDGKRFSVHVKPLPNSGYIATEPSFRGIAKVFMVERDEHTGTITRAADITENVSYTIERNETIVLAGSFERDGEILAYIAYQTDYIDFSFRHIRQSVDEYMELYDGLPLAGYAIDEFGTGSRQQDVYLIGDAFLHQFKSQYGYELLDKLYLLKNEAAGECAGKLRHDYYGLTLDNTYSLQKYVKGCYSEKYGSNLFGGFHSTWWGEGNSGDLWGGNIDYFRLTGNLSGGFVDAQFDAERTMTSMTMLAESLAKYSDTGIAYNMCWDRVPTPEKLDYYQRMLSVRNVRWVGHAYGSTGSFGPGYPEHGTWDQAGRVLSREKAMQAFMGSAVSKPKVAMMYIWESVAWFNNDLMHYHKLSMKALLDKMLQRHIEIDVVPTSDNDLQRFEALIVLWPTMMPESAWSAVKAYAASGKKLIFIGPPGQCTTEGRDIRTEFEALTGARAEEAHAGKRYAGEYEYVAWDLWFTQESIGMNSFPLEPLEGESLVLHGGDLLGVSSGNVKYYSFELPLTAYFDVTLAELESYREVELPDNLISKVSHDGETAVVTLTGRWGAPVDAAFDFMGNRIQIRGFGVAGVRLNAGTVVQAIGEEGTVIEVNGEPIDIVRI
jgi:hypothetical protein